LYTALVGQGVGANEPYLTFGLGVGSGVGASLPYPTFGLRVGSGVGASVCTTFGIGTGVG